MSLPNSVISVNLISPLSPAGDPLPCEQFQEGPRAALLDKPVDLVRLLGVLFLSSGDDVDLTPPWLERSQLTFYTKKQKLSHVPEIETDSSAVRTSVFPHLVPDDIRLVGKAPCLHDRQPLHE